MTMGHITGNCDDRVLGVAKIMQDYLAVSAERFSNAIEKRAEECKIGVNIFG